MNCEDLRGYKGLCRTAVQSDRIDAFALSAASCSICIPAARRGFAHRHSSRISWFVGYMFTYWTIRGRWPRFGLLAWGSL